MIHVEGSPASALRSARQRQWRERVATAAANARAARGVQLDFTIEPGRWVDLDSLVHPVLAGLRDAGAFSRGYPQLDVLVATKREGSATGVVVGLVDPAVLLAAHAPGPVAVHVAGQTIPRPGAVVDKRAWRERVAHAWGDRAPFQGTAWVEVALDAGSLLHPLEVVLDALEPVLGRDPRGQERQEFFPNDHVIEWLRVRRSAGEAPLELRLGSM